MDKSRIVLQNLHRVKQREQSYNWQPFRPGVDICRLYGEPDRGPAAALLRYAPGAVIPAHRHSGYEHIFVLSGAQRDEQAEYPQGTLLISQPGSRHSVVSGGGCIVLAIWNSPVEFEP